MQPANFPEISSTNDRQEHLSHTKKQKSVANCVKLAILLSDI